MLLNGHPGAFVYFWGGLPENYYHGSNFIVFSTLMKDDFLLADSKLEVYREWVLLWKHLKKVLFINKAA